ncbi:MAG: lytic transglycosylase domain-containing protein [Actinomycetota bacterium]|nr:lytic transglycosylase domain-containing protein [Actinomycetota bacterium]
MFSRRAATLKRSSDALTGKLSDLAAERGEIATRSDAARGDLEATGRALADATAVATAAEAELVATTGALESARTEARERIDRAAERFRLGAIDISELRRLADPRLAVGDVPVRAYEAYVAAAGQVDPQLPGCRISWWALAAIGKIETRHGSYGGAVILPNGDVAPRILGPPLTGGRFAIVTDSDGGALDGDTLHDRAVGPMQFIPSTWRASGADGNGDGVADPHNYFDAALAAARYLCRGARGAPLDTEAGMRAAALSYNRSQHYANEVIAAARRYGGLGGAPVTVPD